VGTWHIEQISLDDGDDESGDWSAAKERENAQKAAADPAVIAYFGPHNSGAVGVALPITNRAHLLEIAPYATWPGLTQGGWNPGEPEVYFPLQPRNLARLSAPDTVQAKAAAGWARDQGTNRVLVLQDGSSYSEGLARTFIQKGKEFNLETFGAERADPSGLDASALLEKDHPGGIFYAASSAGQAAMFAKALAAVNRDIPVYSTDTALSDQFLQAAGTSASNWRVTYNGGSVRDTPPSWGGFREAYLRQFKAEPGVVAGLAYDGANLVLNSIAAGDSTREQVLARVLGTSGYLGASGRITLDQNGDKAYWLVAGYTVENGKFVEKLQFQGGP
jgi:branched-chain amino acid transport system substrate-binding protein